MKTIYKMYLDKLPMLNGDTEFCVGIFGHIGNKHNVERFLKKTYGEDLIKSVSLLTASDLDDNKNLEFAFSVEVNAGYNVWRGYVVKEKLDEW